MKKFTTIVLAVLLMMLMVVPVFADDTEVTASAGTFSYDESTGNVSGSYESEGLVNIYVDDELAGGDTLNVPVDAGEHTVKVYENGVLVLTETITAGASEDPGTDEPTDPVVDPTPDPTPSDNNNTTPTQPTNNSGSSTTTNTTKTASSVPKTGDAENMGTFLVLGLGAALTLAAAKRVKSR